MKRSRCSAGWGRSWGCADARSARRRADPRLDAGQQQVEAVVELLVGVAFREVRQGGDEARQPIGRQEPRELLVGKLRMHLAEIEGRAAPALYLIGWVGSVMGLAVLLVSFLAGTAPAAPWLFLVGLVLLVVGLLSATGSQAIEGRRWTDRPYHGPSPVLAFGAVIAVTLIANVAVIAPLVVVGLDPVSPAA